MSLILCPGCGYAPDSRAWPTCSSCLDSLTPAPRLCRFCAGWTCPPKECARPWLEGPISGFEARYLLTGDGYRLLRRWKTRQGPLFDRRILRLDSEREARLGRVGFDAIVPIPQRLSRTLHLGGRSPARTISRWLSRLFKIPICDALLPAVSGESHQGGLSLDQRVQRRIRFTADLQAREEIAGRRILLIDDFMTSGRTLGAAAAILKTHLHAREVQAFALGVRPRLVTQTSSRTSSLSSFDRKRESTSASDPRALHECLPEL